MRLHRRAWESARLLNSDYNGLWNIVAGQLLTPEGVIIMLIVANGATDAYEFMLNPVRCESRWGGGGRGGGAEAKRWSEVAYHQLGSYTMQDLLQVAQMQRTALQALHADGAVTRDTLVKCLGAASDSDDLLGACPLLLIPVSDLSPSYLRTPSDRTPESCRFGVGTPLFDADCDDPHTRPGRLLVIVPLQRSRGFPRTAELCRLTL